SATASANTAGTFNRTANTSTPFDQLKTRTGIMLPTNRIWQYALPNGEYDVHIVAADSNNPNAVNNISVNGYLLHDLDSTDFGDNGFDEFYATVQVTNGKLTVAAGNGSVGPFLSYIDINVIDNTPPSVVSSSFQHAGPQQFQVQFSEDVSGSLSASDLQLVNQTTGQTIDPSSIAVSYNSGSNTATFTFPGFAGGILPIGNYQATIAAANITDAAGNPLLSNFTTSITQVVGDWNLDGQLNQPDIAAAMNALADLNGYRSQHNLSTAQLNLLGDSNQDSQLTNTDLQALISQIASSTMTGGGSISSFAEIMGGQSSVDSQVTELPPPEAKIQPFSTTLFAVQNSIAPFNIDIWQPTVGSSRIRTMIVESITKLIPSVVDRVIVRQALDPHRTAGHDPTDESDWSWNDDLESVDKC
ncbi:MAG TPA: Ig-like domain-containing protein, partial [Pirellulales bacterium]